MSAHTLVQRAIKAGELKRGSACEVCKTNRNLVAHHDDYARPLNVRWLCSSCHKRWHAKNGRGSNAPPVQPSIDRGAKPSGSRCMSPMSDCEVIVRGTPVAACAGETSGTGLKLIRRLVERHGVEALADQAGVHRTQVWKWYTNRSKPSFRSMVTLARLADEEGWKAPDFGKWLDEPKEVQ